MLNIKEGLTAIKLVDLSYNTPEVVNETIRKSTEFKTPTYIFDKESDSKVFVFKSKIENKLFVVYPGTESVKNIETDLQFALTDFDRLAEDCQVHFGFKQSFLALFYELEDCIEGDSELVFTGHSLGAGCAALAAAWYAKIGRKVSYYGAGTPRVGCSVFKKEFDKLVPNSVRYKFGRDIVNTIPAWPFYRHISTEYHLGPSDWSFNMTLLSDILSHRIKNYVEALSKLEKL